MSLSEVTAASLETMQVPVDFIYGYPIFKGVPVTLSRMRGTRRVAPVMITRGPFISMVLSLIPAWISNHIPCRVCDEITYPFPNFNGCTIEVWEWLSNFTSLYNGCNYLSKLRLKLNHISRVPGQYITRCPYLPCGIMADCICKVSFKWQSQVTLGHQEFFRKLTEGQVESRSP